MTTKQLTKIILIIIGIVAWMLIMSCNSVNNIADTDDMYPRTVARDTIQKNNKVFKEVKVYNNHYYDNGYYYPSYYRPNYYYRTYDYYRPNTIIVTPTYNYYGKRPTIQKSNIPVVGKNKSRRNEN